MPKIRTNGAAPLQSVSFDDDELVGKTRASEVRTAIRETRDAEMRAETGQVEVDEQLGDQVWRRPTALDAPPARVGFEQRWVRMTHSQGDDKINWSSKFREGWKPRDPASLPEEWRFLKGAIQGSGSMIVVGGMVLCEMPQKMMAQKRAYIREMVKRQEMSVSTETDKISREGVAAGHAPIERQDTVQVYRGPGRRPSTALAE